MSSSALRWAGGVLAVTLLVANYLWQRFSWAGLAGIEVADMPATAFVVNRTVRLLINDGACLLLLAAVFREARYVRVAGWVFAAEVLVLLPVYLLVKLWWEGPTELSHPLLAQFHRMIVNPLLMLVVGVGLWIQRAHDRADPAG